MGGGQLHWGVGVGGGGDYRICGQFGEGLQVFLSEMKLAEFAFTAERLAVSLGTAVG